MAATVKVIGLDKLLKKLDASQIVGPARTRIIRSAAEYGEGQLRKRVPRAIGTLASSISLQPNKMGAKVSVGNAEAFYGRFLEFGTYSADSRTVHIKRRRFMARTLGATRKELRRLVEVEVGSIERKWAS